MADLFSSEWAQSFKDAWNADDEITKRRQFNNGRRISEFEK